MRLALVSLAALLILICSGCGSGGGAAGTAVSQPTQLKVAVAARAVDPATVYYAVDLVLQLPPGLTVTSDPQTGAVAADALSLADGSAFASGRFVAATGSAPASVRISIADPEGLVVGPLAAITCQVSGATPPAASAFTLSEFSAKDVNGAAMTAVSGSLSIPPQ